MPAVEYRTTDASGAKIRLEIMLPTGEILTHTIPTENVAGQSDETAKATIEEVVSRVARSNMAPNNMPALPSEGSVDLGAAGAPDSKP